jgi:hypothetical protein
LIAILQNGRCRLVAGGFYTQYQHGPSSRHLTGGASRQEALSCLHRVLAGAHPSVRQKSPSAAFPHPSSLDVRSSTPALLGISAALHLGIFEMLYIDF